MKSKIFLMALLVFFVAPRVASASSISPTTWSIGNVGPGNSYSQSFTIDCDDNATCDISADTDWITFTNTHFENTVSSFKATLTLPSDLSLTDYTKHIKLNGVSVVTITFTATKAVTAGHLEPSFSTLIRSLEEGMETERILTVRNMYPDKVEVIDISSTGTIITKEGIEKPIDIEGELGWLDPGKDLVLTVKMNTIDIDPGRYTPRFDIAYYYGGERKTTSINFNINVIKKLTPGGEEGTETQQERQLELLILPEEPLPSEQVTVTLRDRETSEMLDGKVSVEVFTGNDTKITDFIYYNPFTVEVGKKYCLSAEKDGYKTTKKCFYVGTVQTKIKVSPTTPTPDDTVMVQYVTTTGTVIAGGELEINGEVYNGPQISKKFPSGTYSVTGRKTGYETARASFEVQIPFEIKSLTTKITLGQSIDAEFNREADWSIWFGNELVKSDSSKVFNVTPTKPGNYTLRVETYEINVEVEPGWLGLFNFDLSGIPYNGIIGLVLVVAIVWFGYSKIVKRKKKAKPDLGFYPMMNKSPIRKAVGLKPKREED